MVIPTDSKVAIDANWMQLMGLWSALQDPLHTLKPTKMSHLS